MILNSGGFCLKLICIVNLFFGVKVLLVGGKCIFGGVLGIVNSLFFEFKLGIVDRSV